MLVRQEIRQTPVENARAVGRTRRSDATASNPWCYCLRPSIYKPQARNPANGDNHTIARLEFFWFADTGIFARNGRRAGVPQGSMRVDLGLPSAAMVQCRRIVETGLPAPRVIPSKRRQTQPGAYGGL